MLLTLCILSKLDNNVEFNVVAKYCYSFCLKQSQSFFDNSHSNILYFKRFLAAELVSNKNISNITNRVI